MPMQDSRRELALPCLDQEQGNRAGGMNGKATDPGINTGVTPFAAVGVSGMGSQGADALDNCGKPAKGGPNIAGYQRVEVAAIRDRPSALHGVEKALHVLLRGQRLTKLDQIDRHTLSIVEQAAVIASSGSTSMLARARSRSRVPCRS